MAITVRPLTPPTILVNGVAVPAKEVQNSERSFTGTRDSGLPGNSVRTVNAPAEITFTGPAGATIRYTFNSKKVNLGSKKYRSSNPPTVKNGGNGFDGGVLTIRAKSYKNGESSATTEVCIRIVNNGAAYREPDPHIGDVDNGTPL